MIANDEMYQDIRKLREIVRDLRKLGEELIENQLTKGLGIKILKLTRGESIEETKRGQPK